MDKEKQIAEAKRLGIEKVEAYRCPICETDIGGTLQEAIEHVKQPVGKLYPVGLVYYCHTFEESPHVISFNLGIACSLGRGYSHDLVYIDSEYMAGIEELMFSTGRLLSSQIEESFRKGVAKFYSEDQFEAVKAKLSPYLNDGTNPLINADKLIRTTPELENVVKYPWERSELEIKVRATNDAQILGEDGDDYLVVFYEEDMTPVEVRVEKKEFEGHPGNPRPGSWFVLVVYQDVRLDPKLDPKHLDYVAASAWPIPSNWNIELRTPAEWYEPNSDDAQTPEYKYPWEKNSLEVKIKETCEAQIFGEKGDDFFVRYCSRLHMDGRELIRNIEVKARKKAFEGHPGNPRPGSRFRVVDYYDLESDPKCKDPITSAWPIPRNWNKGLRSE